MDPTAMTFSSGKFDNASFAEIYIVLESHTPDDSASCNCTTDPLAPVKPRAARGLIEVDNGPDQAASKYANLFKVTPL